MQESGMPVVLVDLRSAAEAEQLHIAGAVSIPANRIADAKAKFPADKKAPVILYGDNDAEALQAFTAVRSWGFKNASIMGGGYAAWGKAGLPVASKALATEINYVAKMPPGVINSDEFKSMVANLPADTILLDVREDYEAEEGMVKGARNIPTADIADSLADIPKDKKIVCYCNTGVRAEMAYLTLKDKGYDVQYLLANMAVTPDGGFKITEE